MQNSNDDEERPAVHEDKMPEADEAEQFSEHEPEEKPMEFIKHDSPKEPVVEKK